LLLVQGRILDSLLAQLMVLVSYGLLGMLWIVVRTRKILASIARDKARCSDGPH
jgi:hypothetical protein